MYQKSFNNNASGFERHPRDFTVVMTDVREEFSLAVRSSVFRGVIYQHDCHLVDRVLSQMGYQDLMQYAHIASDVRVSFGGGARVDFSKDLPLSLKALLMDRAMLMTRATGQADLKLTMGDLQNSKPHTHLDPFLIGTLINTGTEWEIGRDRGEPIWAHVERGQNLYLSSGVVHRSPPHNDEERFCWLLRPRRHDDSWSLSLS